MKLTWLGHACFKIEKNGYILILDPYTEGSVPGLKALSEKANAVLCSHGHGDHHGDTCIELVKTECKNPFTVEIIDTYHDEVCGAKRGPNKIFLIADGETKVVHLGDLGCDLEAEQKEKLKEADVLLIPVGGHYTIDGKQAAQLVRELQPRIVIPMHYRDDEKGIGFDEIGTVSDFTSHMESVMVIPISEIDSDSEFQAQVIVIQPKNSVKG